MLDNWNICVATTEQCNFSLLTLTKVTKPFGIFFLLSCLRIVPLQAPAIISHHVDLPTALVVFLYFRNVQLNLMAPGFLDEI